MNEMREKIGQFNLYLKSSQSFFLKWQDFQDFHQNLHLTCYINTEQLQYACVEFSCVSVPAEIVFN